MLEEAVSRQAVIDLIHKTIYGFFDIAEDDFKEPMNAKDNLLLEINKAICNGVKALPSAQKQEAEANE